MLSLDHAYIFAVGLLAGAVNAVAGGGTLITFPVLLWLGRDPVLANATNALALWPGSLAGVVALREEAWQMRGMLRWLAPIGVVGSLIGGVLLLATPSRVFSGLVPYLVLAATVLLAFQRPLARALPVAAGAAPSGRRRMVLFLAQLAVSIYGGYFGAAAGILMLAAYALFGVADIHQRNAIKNTLATINNGVAGIYFAVMGAIVWTDALVLAASAVLGGYAGGAVSKRMEKRHVEWFVIAVGVCATLTLALR
jgi:uncharacterized membrane protein YfcA